MPPLPRIRVPMLAELARELRFAPRPVLLRAADRAEALVATLDPAATMPAEWVVFKITGYRPERWPEDPELSQASGAAIRGGLSALVEFLCHQAAWTEAEARAAGGIARSDLARSWGVSEKTLDRLRGEGLISRRATREDGKVVLILMPTTIAWGKAEFASRLASTGRTQRLTETQRARLIRIAERYRRWHGCSLNQTAKVIAAREQRSLEGIRQLLRGEESRRSASGQPAIFSERPPLDARAGRWMERAWRRGAEPGAMAERARCSRAGVQRAINLCRYARLIGVATRAVNSSAQSKPAELRSLELRGALTRSTFGQPGATDLARLIELSRVRVVIGPKDERALVTQYVALREAADAWARSTPQANPQSEALDQAETALRWAARVKAELIRPLLTLAVETVETVIEAPIETLGAQEAASLLTIQIAVVGEAVDHADGSGTGRLAGAAALGLSTAAARWVKLHPRPKKAAGVPRAVRTLPAGVLIRDWTRQVAAWQEWLEPDARLPGVLGQMPKESATLLKLRYGWSGERPLTQTEVAARLGLSRISMPRAERAAIRLGLSLARGLAP